MKPVRLKAPNKNAAHNSLVNAALAYLRTLPESWWWPNPTMGTWDAAQGVYRKARYTGPGDILGCWRGAHVEVEIKTGSGRQSEAQEEHQQRIAAAGGRYIVITNRGNWLDDLAEALRPF